MFGTAEIGAAKIAKLLYLLAEHYNQHKQESHGGLPHRQTPFVPHVLRFEPSKPLQMPLTIVIKRALKHRICGFPNLC